MIPSTTSTYAYDVSNTRIKEVVVASTSTVSTYYPTKYYNITSGTPTKHVFANGVMIATIIGSGSSSTVSTALTDHLTGSSVVTNASGSIIEATDYYPYGAIRFDEQTGFNEQRKFAGHEYDGETGLSYMQARYYNGNTGRFISQDNAFLSVGDEQKLQSITKLNQQGYLTNPQAFNSYSYAYNNPLTYRDETGDFAPLVALGAYAVAYSPVWIPAAITWTAAAGIAITTPLVIGATGAYIQGDDLAGDQMISTSMGVFGSVAAVSEAGLLVDKYINGTNLNQSTKDLGRGAVKVPDDIQKTLDRIESGGSYPHRNDGSIFKNQEHLLPNKPEGYYREYVHPTPGLNHAGEQRVITGQGGERYYTPDHYKTFVEINK